MSYIDQAVAQIIGESRIGPAMDGMVKARRPRAWPEGLSDEEAIQRLQTLCMGACDGVQDHAYDAR